MLASPAFKVKLYVPFALPGLRLMRALRGNFFVKSYVKAKLLTHDPARIASYDADPLLARAISVDILLGLDEASERIVADAAAITLPTQLLISGSDWVVEHAPQHAFFDRLGTAHKEKHVLPGFFHDTLGEKDRARAARQGASLPPRASSTARRHAPTSRRRTGSGFTKDEADALALPLPALSARGLYWATTRAGLRFGGLVSEGIRLGHETGFDSGSTLDYVYRNEARGRTRASAGSSIASTSNRSAGAASGRESGTSRSCCATRCGACVRAASRCTSSTSPPAAAATCWMRCTDGVERPESIVLRDYAARNVRDGEALIAANEARLTSPDSSTPTPSIARASRPSRRGRRSASSRGSTSSSPTTRPCATSLAGLGDAIAAGGFLVYTGQPWHPQLELIARALTSHRGGAAWVMRRRTQGEMDQLVEAAGFRKVAQRIDEWGIFTVSLAERVPQ